MVMSLLISYFTPVSTGVTTLPTVAYFKALSVK
jgi:hypothetical protein